MQIHGPPDEVSSSASSVARRYYHQDGVGRFSRVRHDSVDRSGEVIFSAKNSHPPLRFGHGVGSALAVYMVRFAMTELEEASSTTQAWYRRQFGVRRDEQARPLGSAMFCLGQTACIVLLMMLRRRLARVPWNHIALTSPQEQVFNHTLVANMAPPPSVSQGALSNPG